MHTDDDRDWIFSLFGSTWNPMTSNVADSFQFIAGESRAHALIGHPRIQVPTGTGGLWSYRHLVYLLPTPVVHLSFSPSDTLHNSPQIIIFSFPSRSSFLNRLRWTLWSPDSPDPLSVWISVWI